MKTTFEHAEPILRVTNMAASLKYYVDVLGFRNAHWGTELFTSVNRDGAGIYLCQGWQGAPGTWVWVGVEDVADLYEEYQATGAKALLRGRHRLLDRAPDTSLVVLERFAGAGHPDSHRRFERDWSTLGT